MEDKIEYEVFTATIRTAYPKGSIKVGILRMLDIAQYFETCYGNSEVEHCTVDAPKDPCPEHLYWEKDNCLRCKQQAAAKQLVNPTQT